MSNARPFKSNVERGLVWLDVHFPGWQHGLDLQKLVMKDCFRCVLGQLTGRFHHVVICNGLETLQQYQEDRLSIDEAVNLGFTLDIPPDAPCPEGTYAPDWKALTKEWILQCEERMV